MSGSLAGGSLASQPSASSRIVPRASMLATWAPTWSNQLTFTGPTIYTMARLDSVETPFSAYRLILANCDTAGTLTLAGVYAMPTSTAANFGVATDVNGNVAAPDQVTFGGSATPVIPAATTGTAGGVIPGLLASDWIPRQSIARIDGGVFPLLQSWCITGNAGGKVLGGIPVSDTVFPPLLGGRTMVSAIAGQNLTSAVQAGNTPVSNYSTTNAYCVVIGVQVIANGKVTTMMNVGDSLARGWMAMDNSNSYGLRAIVDVLSTPAHRVSYVQHGWESTKLEDFIANAQAMFNLVQPQFVTIPTSSPNNTTGNYTPQQQVMAALQFANTVMQAGSVPILVTPFPFGAVTASDITVGNIVRSIVGQGPLVLDVQSIMLNGTPLTVGASAPASYYGTDGHHGNDLSYGIIGRALGNMLLPYVK